MNFGRFQKVATISNTFTCEACPIVIKKGVIIRDRSRGLQLLNLIVSNRGNVTVDEIEVKIISYDRYGNPVPEKNGQVGQICRFTDSGCLPDQRIGEGEVILLPSEQVVNCDVMVTRVKTAGNVELFFTEADYEIAVPQQGVLAVDGTEKNRKLYQRLIIALAAVGVLYLAIFLTSWIVRSFIIPSQNEKTLQTYLNTHQYAAALNQLDNMDEDAARREEIVLLALEYYMDSDDYEQALKFAAKSSDANKRYDTLCRIVDELKQGGNFDRALKFATDQKNQRLISKVYADAVEYYTEHADFRTALAWVALSGDVSLSDGVYREAVTQYTAQGDYVTALDYALRIGEREVILTVYNPAILMLMREENYNSAALYIARCNLPNDTAVTAQVKAEAYEKADDNFIRLNAHIFWPVMTFEQKQSLFASPLAIETDAIAILDNGTVVSTSKSYGWDVTNAVSVDIGSDHALVLRADGTVMAQGDNTYRQCETSKWTNIVGIACGQYHTVGLCEDGTVVAVGNNDYGQCDVSTWTDIIQIVCGPSFTVGLKSDGTVMATGRNNAGQCNVDQWREVVMLSAGHNHTLGLRYTGTVYAAGVAVSAKCDVDEWQGVQSIAAGSNHSVALLADGTVLVAGASLIDISSVTWTDTLLIAAGTDNILGVRETSVSCVGSGKISTSALEGVRVPGI